MYWGLREFGNLKLAEENNTEFCNFIYNLLLNYAFADIN